MLRRARTLSALVAGLALAALTCLASVAAAPAASARAAAPDPGFAGGGWVSTVPGTGGDRKVRFEFAYRIGQVDGVVRGKVLVVRWTALDGTRYVVHVDPLERCGVIFDDGVAGSHASLIVDGPLSVQLGLAEIPTGRWVGVGFAAVDVMNPGGAGFDRVTVAVWDGATGGVLAAVGDATDPFAAPALLSYGNVGVSATTLGVC